MRPDATDVARCVFCMSPAKPAEPTEMQIGE